MGSTGKKYSEFKECWTGKILKEIMLSESSKYAQA